MPRALGLDIGNRRIGVAISDATKLIATPLTVIDRKTEDALARLRAITAEYKPDVLVAGVPINVAGQSNEQAGLTRAAAHEFAAALDLALVLVDESFSSAEAKAIIASKRRKDQPQHDDAIAASVILQRYLNGLRDDLEYDE
jgi:putative holliday junction resolvase